MQNQNVMNQRIIIDFISSVHDLGQFALKLLKIQLVVFLLAPLSSATSLLLMPNQRKGTFGLRNVDFLGCLVSIFPDAASERHCDSFRLAGK